MKRAAFLMLILPWVVLWIPPAFSEVKPRGPEPVNVKVVSLHEGQTVHGSISIEAVVSNPSAIDHVDFYFQEPGAKDRYGWKDYAPPYFWGGDGQKLDTKMFDDGPASAVAFCMARGTKKLLSAHRVHFAINNGKPHVKILAPREEEDISGEVLIRIDAADTGSIRGKAGIAEVYVYVDGELLDKLTKAPFEARMSSCLLSQGKHSLHVVVEDSEGFTNSQVIMVNTR